MWHLRIAVKICEFNQNWTDTRKIVNGVNFVWSNSLNVNSTVLSSQMKEKIPHTSPVSPFNNLKGIEIANFRRMNPNCMRCKYWLIDLIFCIYDNLEGKSRKITNLPSFFPEEYERSKLNLAHPSTDDSKFTMGSWKQCKSHSSLT